MINRDRPNAPTIAESLAIIEMLARDETVLDRVLVRSPRVVDQAFRDLGRALGATEPLHPPGPPDDGQH